MVNCFFDGGATKQTTLVIANVKVVSFQHVARVQSVIHEKSSEYLDPHDTMRAPEQSKCWVGVRVLKIELVVVSGSVICFAPGVMPDITRRRGGVHM